MTQILSRLATKARAIRRTQRYRRTLLDMGATFTSDPARSGAELVTIEGLKFSIKSEEDLFILTEVFDRQCYNFRTSAETIVIDIGMNIGIASLSFAKDANVQHVYSFEPFPGTYALARANMRLNWPCEEKITAQNFGLSDRDAVEELPYIEERKGSLGVNGMPRSFTPSRQDLNLQRIELRDAAIALFPIMEAHPDANLVLKMDCEGSEYAIFRSLDDAGLLGRFQAIMLEWHKQGPEELLSALQKYGYAAFTFNDGPRGDGMLYAVNPKPPHRPIERQVRGQTQMSPIPDCITLPLADVVMPSL